MGYPIQVPKTSKVKKKYLKKSLKKVFKGWSAGINFAEFLKSVFVGIFKDLVDKISEKQRKLAKKAFTLQSSISNHNPPFAARIYFSMKNFFYSLFLLPKSFFAFHKLLLTNLFNFYLFETKIKEMEYFTFLPKESQSLCMKNWKTS